MRFSLQLLGGAVLQGEAGPVTGRAAHKRRLALMALLAAARGRPVPRERILGLLWPESPAASGRHLLSESLTVLRRELGEDVFISRGDDLLLNREIVDSDLEAFEGAVEAGDNVGAARLYSGPFLDGFYVADAPEFERWAEGERERVGRMFASALEELAGACEASSDVRGAAEWWRRLAAHEPYSSRVSLRLVQALAAAGEREAALLHAGVHAALVREELGTEPSLDLQTYVEGLRANAGAGIIAGRRPEPAPELAQVPADARSETLTGDRAGTHSAGPRVAQPDASTTAQPAEPGGPPEHASQKRSAVVWFADIAGFAALRRRSPAAAEAVLDLFQDAARRVVRRGGGHVVEFIGDGVLAEFDEVAAAATAAVGLVRVFERRTRRAGASATLRVGLHTGLVSNTDDGGLYGDPVSVASRLQGRADPGQVLASGQVRTALAEAPGFRFAWNGMVQEQGEAGSVAAYAVEVERLTRPSTKRPTSPPAPPTADAPLRRPQRAVLAIAVLLVAAVAAALTIVRSQARDDTGVAGALDPNRVAVMYLTADAREEELRALARGLTDQLIYELSQVDVLDVVPPSGVRPFRDSPVPPDSAARALRAGTLLEGTLERSGDRLRLRLYLTDAATGSRLRSTVVNSRTGEIFALEEELALQASRFLRWRLGRALEVRTHSSGTRNPQARRLVLLAEQAREDAGVLLAGDPLEKAAGERLLARADTMLMRAEVADPRWAEPPALRGWVAIQRSARSEGLEERQLLTAAAAYAERALRLRPSDPRALELRGNVRWTLSLFPQAPDSAEQLMELARRDLSAAVEADPNRGTAWSMLSQLMRLLGDHPGAYLAAERAARADPYLLKGDLVQHRLIRSAISAGRFDLARQHCAAGARTYPQDWKFAECRLVLLAYEDQQAPDVAAAAVALSRLDAVDPPAEARADGRVYQLVYRRMLYASVLARAGQHDSARAMVARARQEVSHRPDMRASLAYDEAHVHLCLGERAAAVRALEELFRLQPLQRRSIAADYQFRSLRTDPAFIAAVTGG
jgi:class 3 adenylate cyclase/DNA-binding SARP family transcriptional activator/TolB-like protein/tetratricopeptide (TPR) repeat protein